MYSSKTVVWMITESLVRSGCVAPPLLVSPAHHHLLVESLLLTVQCWACIHATKRLPCPFPGSFPIAGLSGPEHTMNTEGREDFAEDSECHSNTSQDPGEQDSVTGEYRGPGMLGG